MRSSLFFASCRKIGSPAAAKTFLLTKKILVISKKTIDKQAFFRYNTLEVSIR